MEALQSKKACLLEIKYCIQTKKKAKAIDQMLFLPQSDIAAQKDLPCLRFTAEGRTIVSIKVFCKVKSQIFRRKCCDVSNFLQPTVQSGR